MSFDAALHRCFPGALDAPDFLRRTAEALAPFGFSAESAIACVGVCRDELTRPFVDAVHDAWGESFDLCSLAGMVTVGKTGIYAATQHAPETEAVARYVFFAMPHIGVAADGAAGCCLRPGQRETSSACGALVALHGELARGSLSVELDPDDLEQSLLRRRLAPLLAGKVVPDIVGVTRLAYDVIREDLDRILGLTLDPGRCDYAVLTGIQVHTPSGIDAIWPGQCYAVVGGERRALALG